MSYIELKVITDSDFSEILMAELGEIGFETFTEEVDGLNAYIPEDQFVQDSLDEILNRYRDFFAFSYSINTIEKQNWNAEWEANYPPIRIGEQVVVRASFHEPDPKVVYDIVINPKMSFGTGHHETTSMVMAHQLEISHKNLSVLDIGCGTGILAILAEKLGATELSAFDIEEWAAENSRENAELNNCKHIAVRQGTIENEPLKQYDIILANINRNILLRDINQYINYLKPGGAIIISGFYTSDQADIEAKFAEFGLEKVAEKSKNNWASVRFVLAN
ncbi:MAG: 50S ribosomal protein L11 methyltransferase [Bacteroidota bacterium]